MTQSDLDNNFMYHAPKEGQPELYQIIRSTAKCLAELINEACPESREKAMAIARIEEGVMWANSAIARHE